MLVSLAFPLVSVILMSTLALCTCVAGTVFISSLHQLCSVDPATQHHFLYLLGLLTLSSLLGPSLLCPQNIPYVSHYLLKLFL